MGILLADNTHSIGSPMPLDCQSIDTLALDFKTPKGWVPIAKLKKMKKDFFDLGATWVS